MNCSVVFGLPLDPIPLTRPTCLASVGGDMPGGCQGDIQRGELRRERERVLREWGGGLILRYKMNKKKKNVRGGLGPLGPQF